MPSIIRNPPTDPFSSGTRSKNGLASLPPPHISSSRQPRPRRLLRGGGFVDGAGNAESKSVEEPNAAVVSGVTQGQRGRGSGRKSLKQLARAWSVDTAKQAPTAHDQSADKWTAQHSQPHHVQQLQQPSGRGGDMEGHQDESDSEQEHGLSTDDLFVRDECGAERRCYVAAASYQISGREESTALPIVCELCK